MDAFTANAVMLDFDSISLMDATSRALWHTVCRLAAVMALYIMHQLMTLQLWVEQPQIKAVPRCKTHKFM